MPGALRERSFLLLWAGGLSATLGFFMSVVVQAVVAYELTGTNAAVGWVVFARGAAMALLGPIGGALADRVSKRALLLACQGAAALVFAGLAALMASNAMTVSSLTLGAFLVGVTFAFLGPARQAYAVELVPAEHRGNAVALNQVALNASRVGGPAVAGFLLTQPVRATGAFAAMSALYALAVACHARLPRYERTGPPSELSVWTDVREGLAYVHGHPQLRSLVLYFVLAILLGFPYVVVLPGLVARELHGDAQVVSMLFSTSALGGLIASLAVAPLADGRRAVPVHLASGAGFALSLLWLSSVTDLLQANLAAIAIGVSTGSLSTLNGAVLLRASEARYFGRVISLAMLAFAGFGLAGLPIGLLADTFGESVCLQLMAAGVGITVLALAPRIYRASKERSMRVQESNPV